MKRLLMILFMAGVLLIPSIAFTFQNEPDNFRGIKWGTTINELPDMQKIIETSSGMIYTRKGDKMKIGDANLDYIYYFFYKDQFYKIYIEISSESDFDKIKATLLNIYGKATRDELLIKEDIWDYISEWIWNGNEVQVKLFYETFKNIFLSYIYKPIEFEVSKELKRKTKERREKARERAKERTKEAVKDL